jgi:hypothetical protein
MSTSLQYLVPYLRLRLGDTNPEAYRYDHQWLVTSLIFGTKLSARYWRNKYLVTDAGIVTRNPDVLFEIDESLGTIEDKDEPVLVLLALIVILEGSLENTAWNIASWKDAEISFSNLEGGRIRDANIKRLHDELNSLVTSPTRRLARTIKGSLPGYNPTGSSGIEKTGY